MRWEEGEQIPLELHILVCVDPKVYEVPACFFCDPRVFQASQNRFAFSWVTVHVADTVVTVTHGCKVICAETNRFAESANTILIAFDGCCVGLKIDGVVFALDERPSAIQGYTPAQLRRECRVGLR